MSLQRSTYRILPFGPRARKHRGFAERIACPDCGLVQLLPLLRDRQVAECARCKRTFAGPARGHVEVPLALCLTALALLVAANAFPTLSVASFGARRVSWLFSGVEDFWKLDYPSLSILVAIFAVILPFAFLLMLAWILINVRAGRTADVGRVFRFLNHLRPWMMLEVYLVGGFVAYSRLAAVATVEVGVGGWCLLAASLLMLIAVATLDDRTVWESLPQIPPVAVGERTIACTSCEMIVASTAHGHPCPRCGAKLHVRKPHALRRTLALVAAGYLLYIPANFLPVLTLVQLGSEERNTILGGALELVRNDLWPLALIVFLASIVVPLIKLGGLTWMLIATYLRSSALLVERTRLYRFVDLIGRWSNIDVFMGSVLVALLRFGTLTSIRPGNGLVAFAGVVMVTMFATVAFDARLMWDAAARRTA